MVPQGPNWAQLCGTFAVFARFFQKVLSFSGEGSELVTDAGNKTLLSAF
jgi:hypothetical protein